MRQEGYDRSYISLEEESGINLYAYDKQIDLLRKLILDAEWEEVEKFIEALKQIPDFPYNNALFEIKKEKLLEEVELQQNASNLEDLRQELHKLQKLNLKNEFDQLIQYLESNKEDIPSNKKNIISRRLNTFNLIRKYLSVYYPISDNESNISQGKFNQILSQLIEKSIYSNEKNYKTLTINQLESLLSSNNNKRENNHFIAGNDINLSSIDNEDDSKYNHNNSNKNETNKPSTATKLKIIDVYDDVEVNVEENDDDNEKSDELFHITNNDNNELTDLDQEEYYMKSCYDYYNYDITTLTLKKVIEDNLPIRISCFSPKGDYFAIGTNSSSIKIFDLSYVLSKFNKRNSYSNRASSKMQNQKETIGMIFEQKYHHEGSIYCMDWSSSGKLLASGSNDETIKLMNIPELDNSELRKEHETLELQIKENKGIVKSICFEPTNDLVLLSTNSIEPYVKIWDTETGSSITYLEGHDSNSKGINTVKWSNDSQLCASAGKDRTIRFWDLRDYKCTSILSGIEYSEIRDLCIYTKQKALGSTIIASGHSDGLITIWDYSKRAVIHSIHGHNGEVRSISFSPDGKHLMSGGFDGKIKIFDVENNFDLLGEVQHFDRVVSCKWHPEIPLIVSTSADRTARVWIPQKV